MSQTNDELYALLELAKTSDYHEEPAWEYLEDRQIPVLSHSRQYVITRAYNAGWRPNAFI